VLVITPKFLLFTASWTWSDARLYYHLESQLFHFNAVCPGQHIRHVITLRIVGDALVVNACAGVDDDHRSLGNYPLAGIGDAAREWTKNSCIVCSFAASNDKSTCA
jgi:hypothetical protein